MSFATYANLKTEFTNWLGHDLFEDNYDDFVTLFEARACRLMHVRENTTTATITMSGGSGSLPTDYLETKRVTWTGTPNNELDYLHPTYFRALYPTTDQGTPNHYTIEGANIVVRPLNDTALQMLYVQKTAAVSSTLNWLFTKHPDVYLFGSLMMAEAFGSNDERIPLWKQMVDEAFSEILRQDFNGRGQMAVRVMGSTP
jgi:hypothetical protein